MPDTEDCALTIDSCEAGFYLANNLCNACGENCLACATADVCIVCALGYGPTATADCA